MILTQTCNNIWSNLINYCKNKWKTYKEWGIKLKKCWKIITNLRKSKGFTWIKWANLVNLVARKIIYCWITKIICSKIEKSEELIIYIFHYFILCYYLFTSLYFINYLINIFKISLLPFDIILFLLPTWNQHQTTNHSLITNTPKNQSSKKCQYNTSALQNSFQLLKNNALWANNYLIHTTISILQYRKSITIWQKV